MCLWFPGTNETLLLQEIMYTCSVSLQVDYTDDESMLIAEIMRDAHLEEKKTKAGRVDVKLFDAQRRRMCTNYMKGQNAEKKAELTG